MTKYPRAIFGAGKQASHILHLLEALGGAWKDCLLFDDCYSSKNEGARGLPILGTVSTGFDLCEKKRLPAIVALGTKAAAARYAIFHEALRRKIDLVNLIHPSCVISPSATLRINVVMMPGCTIGADCSLGSLCCLFSNVTVEHDCRIEENVVIGPGATLSGFGRVGSHCFIGAGAVLAPEVNVHEGTLVGAGAVVISDLPSGWVCFGVPARVRREVEVGDDVPTKEQLKKVYPGKTE